jgi:hypothetical protein
MGRPRKNVPSEDYVRITALAAKGITQPRIASALGMSVRTFRERLTDDPVQAKRMNKVCRQPAEG